MAPGELLTRYLQTKREHCEEQNGDDNPNDVANEGLEVKSEVGSVPTVFEAGSLADKDIEAEHTISAPASDITAYDDADEDYKQDSL